MSETIGASTRKGTARHRVRQGKHDVFCVPVGERTDFASVPRVFVCFLPRYGRYTKAAILHDYLWSVKISAGDISRLNADGIFRQAMRDLGVPFLAAGSCGQRSGGALAKPDGRKDWLKEAWCVLLITLLTVPIVGSAAIVILIALFAFYLVELVVWLPLKLVHRVKTSRGQPAKAVNAPPLPVEAVGRSAPDSRTRTADPSRPPRASARNSSPAPGPPGAAAIASSASIAPARSPARLRTRPHSTRAPGLAARWAAVRSARATTRASRAW
jgi:Protein of unknown function (DUF1353)